MISTAVDPQDGGIHCSIARLLENAYGFFLSGDSGLHFTTVGLSRIGTFAEKPEKSAFNSPISVTPGFPLITVNLHTVGAQSRFGTRKGRVPPQNLAPPESGSAGYRSSRARRSSVAMRETARSFTRGTTSRTRCTECRASAQGADGAVGLVGVVCPEE